MSSAPTSATADFEYLSDVGAIYASFILADYAKIKFTTGNELTIVDSNDNPVAGITGGGNILSDDPNVRFWAGTASWDGSEWEDLIVSNAEFRVYSDGSLVATKADIKGNIITAQGNIYLGSQEDAPQWAQLDSKNFDIIAIKDDNDRITFRAGGSEQESQVVNDFAEDGSGHVANGNISWASNGSFQIKSADSSTSL